jgi:glycosyltransferase involved in cell wall biosynthesis
MISSVKPDALRILHLMSCRGWSSDAYWTARAVAALKELGQRVTLVTQEGSDERVGMRLRQEGVKEFETLDFGSGFKLKDPRAIREIRKLADGHDLIHVHRGKEHWLAAFANRGLARPRPLVRTRHIIHPVKSHLLNRWLYRRATDMVVAVTERIRQRYLGSGLVLPEKIVTLYGGVDTRSFSPEVRGDAVRAKLNLPPGAALLGLVGGLRVMKGHQTLVRAIARLKRDGLNCRALFVGQGSQEAVIRREIKKHGLEEEIVLAGFFPDLSEAMATLDIALYVPYESDGMGRVVSE